jgi:hypothetical protein
VALFARIAGIGVLCGVVVYVTDSAFVPSMGTGGWDYLYMGFALLGLALGAGAAIFRRKDDERR